MRLVPYYRREASPLHAARASIGLAYCGALALCIVLFWQNPLVSAASIAAVLLAARGARVFARVGGAARAALWFALLPVLVNALVSSSGTTVLVRLGTVLGHRFDITLESIIWGLVTGLSVGGLWLLFALYAASVDPDELLRGVRRVSHRSALTASLATRLVPVLARDAERRGEAARCRPQPPGRIALVRAALAGSLDRAVDIAAALETRGYATARRPARLPRPWSRHDTRFAVAATTLATIAIVAKLDGVGAVSVDPALHLTVGAREGVLLGAVLLAGALPFAGVRARLGVARA